MLSQMSPLLLLKDAVTDVARKILSQLSPLFVLKDPVTDVTPKRRHRHRPVGIQCTQFENVS